MDPFSVGVFRCGASKRLGEASCDGIISLSTRLGCAWRKAWQTPGVTESRHREFGVQAAARRP